MALGLAKRSYELGVDLHLPLTADTDLSVTQLKTILDSELKTLLKETTLTAQKTQKLQALNVKTLVQLAEVKERVRLREQQDRLRFEPKETTIVELEDGYDPPDDEPRTTSDTVVPLPFVPQARESRLRFAPDQAKKEAEEIKEGTQLSAAEESTSKPLLKKQV